MLREIEEFLHRTLVVSGTALTAVILVGLPAVLLGLLLRECFYRGKDMMVIIGGLTIVVIAYCGLLHFKTRALSTDTHSPTPQVVHSCARIGSVLLSVSFALILIYLVEYLSRILS
ncbi:MAG: hypothetical protein JXD19_04465 [Deltaproteobacteria bacterium]|nr:hypothetical protein [Deltaproteobacteria bacterium]